MTVKYGSLRYRVRFAYFYAVVILDDWRARWFAQPENWYVCRCVRYWRFKARGFHKGTPREGKWFPDYRP